MLFTFIYFVRGGGRACRSTLVEVKDNMGIILYTVLVLGIDTKRQTQRERQTPLPVESCPLSLRVLLSNPGWS